MEQPIDTYELPNGHTLKVYQDLSDHNPREWDNMCEMHCFHKSYTLGDNTDIDADDYESFNEMVTANFSHGEEGDIILNLYLLDHSGISISYDDFGDKWDSGQVGFAVVTVDTIIKEYGDNSPKSRDMAMSCMKSEIDTYNQFLTGAVYGYVIVEKETCNLGHEHEHEIDSCWGFFGHSYDESGLFDHAGYNSKKKVG